MRESVIHQRHQRHWVRGDLHEGAEAIVEQLTGRVREQHGLAGAADEVIGIVEDLTRLVHAIRINRGVQRHGDGLWVDIGDLEMQLSQNGIQHGGVTCALHVQQASELALFLEELHQLLDWLARSTHGGHARRGVHGGFHGGEFWVLRGESSQLFSAELHHGHGTLLVFR